MQISEARGLSVQRWAMETEERRDEQRPRKNSLLQKGHSFYCFLSESIFVEISS